MKIIYIEADAKELNVRPTVMSAVESLINKLCFTFGACTSLMMWYIKIITVNTSIFVKA